MSIFGSLWVLLQALPLGGGAEEPLKYKSAIRLFLLVSDRNLNTMSNQRYTLVDSNQPSTSKHRKSVYITKWEACLLRQKETGKALQCPSKSTKVLVGKGYKSLVFNRLQFQELGFMPMELVLTLLDDRECLKSTMMTHINGWHKT